MSDAVTDTHGLIWYLENSPRLGSSASKTFDACDRGEAIIYVPTICLVEIIYLQEKGRIPTDLLARSMLN
jgi:PIN domain nuclease of toxin-antitoxin system